MRRKIPKSSREEINRISADKQDSDSQTPERSRGADYQKGGRGSGTDSQRRQEPVWEPARQKRH